MAGNSKQATGWGFRLVAVIILVAVVACVFGYAYASTGNEVKSMIRAAVPVGSAIIVTYLLGKISAISHKRWHIFVSVLLIAAAVVCLQIAGVF